MHHKNRPSKIWFLRFQWFTVLFSVFLFAFFGPHFAWRQSSRGRGCRRPMSWRLWVAPKAHMLFKVEPLFSFSFTTKIPEPGWLWLSPKGVSQSSPTVTVCMFFKVIVVGPLFPKLLFQQCSLVFFFWNSQRISSKHEATRFTRFPNFQHLVRFKFWKVWLKHLHLSNCQRKAKMRFWHHRRRQLGIPTGIRIQNTIKKQHQTIEVRIGIQKIGLCQKILLQSFPFLCSQRFLKLSPWWIR